ncbi:MAG: hypothetical protein WBA10_13150 [Elainellaceae cyanobacterium]
MSKQPMPQDANRQSTQSSSASASSALALYSSGDSSAEIAVNRSGARHSAATASIVKRIDSTALEASANQLVDEVFEDIDYLLDGSPPIHAVSQAAGAQGPSFTANVFIPPAVEGSSSALNSMVMLWGLFPAIVGGLCLGLFLAFGIVIGGRQVASPPETSGAGTTAAASPEDEGFLAYLDQALGGIEPPQPDNAAPSVTKLPTSDAAKSSSALTATSFAGANPLLLTPPVNVPTAASPPLLPVIPIQTAPARFSSPPPAAPAPIAPQPLAPQASPSASGPSPAPAAPAPESAPKAEIIPNIAPSPHVLVGLLQLGDRSAAIFEFDDGARRVRIGDGIGSSGWSLVSISQDEAVIRRNGEVRSIYIGQRI